MFLPLRLGGWGYLLHVWCIGTDMQAYLAAGARPSKSLEMAVRAPSSYGITTMPQPQSAGLMLYNALKSDTSGAVAP